MYDYIIVGAGSAGCVLANRLSVQPETRVLLLEAGGPDKQQEIHIPAAFSKLFKSAVDWAYSTEAQPHLNNRQLYWPRGKMLGGSSSINAMIYIRGHRHNYDDWEAAGNEGWSYDDVLPAFKKAEDQERGASEYHGAGGPLRVSDLRYHNVLTRTFVEAAAEIGIPQNDDFNGAQPDGAGFYQVTQKGGRRYSAADAYLKPALKRANLTVRTGAQSTRVLFENQRAVGVEYVQAGRTQQERAEREIILCGGAINSPQLLMLSGVGRAEHLRQLGIPVVLDLPGVGQNLRDHLAVSVTYECTKPVSLASAEQLGNLLSYLAAGKGPLTSNIAEAGGFVKTNAGAAIPDLQYHFAPVYFMDHGFANPKGHGFTLGPTLLYPESVGQITLRSKDPLAPPAIEPNYLAGDNDLRVLVAGVKQSRQLAQTKAFAPYRGAEIWPGAEAKSDQQIGDHVRAHAQTLYHPVGTCKMGADPAAVVDAQLRVHGLERLRVVDASIMPSIVGGNTNAPTIMIAEKAAGLIANGGKG